MKKDPKILIVDDEKLVRRSMQKTLQRAGFEVETAADCVEGWEIFETVQISKNPFDLAILDLNIPDFDGVLSDKAGLVLLNRILERQPDFPVIMLTAYDDVSKATVAIHLGAKSYLVKGREQNLVELINLSLNSVRTEWIGASSFE